MSRVASTSTSRQISVVEKFLEDLASLFPCPDDPDQRVIIVFNAAVKTALKNCGGNPKKVEKSQSIRNTITAFKSFVTRNERGILNLDAGKFDIHEIVFSQNAKIDFAYVFSNTDTRSRCVVWRHLVTIYGMFKKDRSTVSNLLSKISRMENGYATHDTIIRSKISDNVAELRKSLYKDVPEEETKEEKWVANIVGEIVPLIGLDDSENHSPMDLASRIFQSGALEKITEKVREGIESGEVNSDVLSSMAKNVLDETSRRGNEYGIDTSEIMKLAGSMMATTVDDDKAVEDDEEKS